MASIEGDEQAVLEALDRLSVPPDGEVLGPVALDDLGTDDAPVRASSSRKSLPANANAPDPATDGIKLRALIRAPQAQRKVLSASLHTVAAGRSARKEGGGVRIRVDPLDLF